MDLSESDVRYILKSIKESFDKTEKGFKNVSLNSFKLGFVVEQSKNTSSTDTYIDYGSVKVIVPEYYSNGTLTMWAIPLRLGMGSLEIPPIGGTVIVIGMGDMDRLSTMCYYINMSTISSNPLYLNYNFQGYFNTEQLGFTRNPAIPFKGYIGGRFVKKVLENPSDCRLVASTNKYMIYESDTDKELQIRTDDDFKIKIHTGDEGKIQIGYLHPINDTAQTGNVDVEIDAGTTGDVTIETIDGDIHAKTQTGNVFLEAGSCSIKVTPNGVYIVGNTYISGLLMVSKEVHWQTVGFSPTGTPPYATATANRGSTHTHMTGVGPSAPPTPGT